MRDFIIFGKGDFADILTYIIEKEMRRNVAAYTVNKTFLDTNQYRGKRVVPMRKLSNFINRQTMLCR